MCHTCLRLPRWNTPFRAFETLLCHRDFHVKGQLNPEFHMYYLFCYSFAVHLQQPWYYTYINIVLYLSLSELDVPLGSYGLSKTSEAEHTNSCNQQTWVCDIYLWKNFILIAQMLSLQIIDSFENRTERYCDYKLPPSFLSAGNSLQIYFKSDSTMAPGGYDAYYYSVRPSGKQFFSTFKIDSTVRVRGTLVSWTAMELQKLSDWFVYRRSEIYFIWFWCN